MALLGAAPVLAPMPRWLGRGGVGPPLAARLRDEQRDPPGGLGLVLLVWRERGDGQRPQPCPLGLVVDLADAHLLDLGVVANLDGRIRAQVVDPYRVVG